VRVNNRYALDARDDDWNAALSKGKAPSEGTVVAVKSVKAKKRKGEKMKDVLEELDTANEKKNKKRRH
jgi:hypothetical protein